MRLSIIIVNYKTPALLKLCIKSIQNSSLSIPSEIIAINSATDEESEELIRFDFPEVTFFGFKENVGYAKAVNAGIKKSKGDFILILNPDIIVTEGSIKKMLEFMEENPQVGILAPQLINFNGTPQNSCFRFYKPLTILYRRTIFKHLPFAKRALDEFLIKDYDYKTPRDVDWVMGSAMMVTRAALKTIGLMDERFFMYFEDVDWCRRFWQAGLRVVYFPYAKMYHYHQRLSATHQGVLGIFNKATRIHISSAVKYFQKYGLKEL